MKTKNDDRLKADIIKKIKKRIDNEYIVLDDDKELLIDSKIGFIIDNLIDEKELDNDSLLSRQIIDYLTRYYVALYYNNVELLHNLEENNFNFNVKPFTLFVFDNKIACKFNLEEYIDVLKGNIGLFANFYMMLYRNREDVSFDEEMFINKFCQIIKSKKDLTKIKDVNHIRVDNLLNLRVLMNFSNDEILRLNDEQKCILNKLDNVRENSAKFIIKLIKEYNYDKNLEYWDIYRKYFTIEEIIALSKQDIKLYNYAFNSLAKIDVLSIQDIINKIKMIKKSDPYFNKLIPACIYEILTIDEIIDLSSEAIANMNDKLDDYIINEKDFDLGNKTLKKIILAETKKDKVRLMIKHLIKK